MVFLKYLFKPKIEIYTDGGAKDKLGAWSYVIVKNKKIIREQVGEEPLTDCNQMELRAAIEALKSLNKKTKATVYSDSRILIDSLTMWMNEWRENNWMKKKGYPLPYANELKELDQLNHHHNLKWQWIRGHSGNVFNERCDELCRKILKS